MEIIGYIAAALTSFGFLPQAVKSFKTKSTKDISFIMLITLFAGMSLWLIYGLIFNLMPVILANIVSIALISFTLFFKIKYR